MNFCSQCGKKVENLVPPGEDRPRFICRDCGFIHYQNPKLVVGCIPKWEDKVLLVRRSIEPRYGKWTLPAGYLENGETVEEGARRETFEEAGATVLDLQPYLLYNIPQISQIYLMFRTQLQDGRFAAGDESLEAKLFEEGDIPWDEIAFKVIGRALEQYLSDRPVGKFPFQIDDIHIDKKKTPFT